MSAIQVEIDKDSGFCFGVVNAIKSAENELDGKETLYCLGDIVHNSLEVERLQARGLRTINHEAFARLRGEKVLLRAHGEPPSTYRFAVENNIRIIDATCPVVLRLQQKIHKCYKDSGPSCQLVIYGKEGHAEVNGLVGQTEGTAIVVESTEDLDKVDFSRNITLFSQTTKPLEGFRSIVEAIRQRCGAGVSFTFHDTICRQVSNRMQGIKAFAATHDWIYFVAGRKSSNGKVLFEECLKANPNCFFISHAGEITELLPPGIGSVGVCGATSTPEWLMEEVATHVKKINNIPDKPGNNMSFSSLCCSIFEQATQEYHLTDDVNAPMLNPYPLKSIEYYLYLKNRIDAVQWHLEDLIRDPAIDPTEALSLKRRIDKSNQERTDFVELIDSYFLDRYKEAVPLPCATINTESPAWAVDRLSILVLKIYHMNEETIRFDATPAHKESCADKLAVLLEQKKDLCGALDRLLDDIREGRKYMKVYKQMKMYNDPLLNPILYTHHG
jgi:4-hydroxy-3-methylbut-2-enyl diphosphate reductase